MSKSIVVPVIVILIAVAIAQSLAYFAADPKDFILNYLALFTISVQWIAFLHAGGIICCNERTEKYYDLIGSMTFLSTILLSISLSPKTISARQIVLTTFAIIWALRLGAFLFNRIHKNAGVDSRFTEIKQNNFRFLMAWSLQGLWVFLTLIPILILNQQNQEYELSWVDYVAFFIWTFGFIFEAVSDYQKFKFRSCDANKEKFMQSGLWKYSRHPNYFGEIVLWTGIAISSFMGTRSPYVFISPVFVALLLIFVSGIPALEKKANDVYANDEEYQKYKKSTPVLVPLIGCRGDAMF